MHEGGEPSSLTEYPTVYKSREPKGAILVVRQTDLYIDTSTQVKRG